MSRTFRDQMMIRSNRFWEQLWSDPDRPRDWGFRQHLAELAGIPSHWRFGTYRSAHWLRTQNHRRVRHHVKIVCHTRHWRRLHAKDSVLKDWLD